MGAVSAGRASKTSALYRSADTVTAPIRPANNAKDAVSGARWTGETLEWWITLDGDEEVGVLRELNSQDQLVELVHGQLDVGFVHNTRLPAGDEGEGIWVLTTLSCTS